MNELYLKLMSYGHSAIVSLERAVDIADRTYLFGKTDQLRTQIDLEKDISQRYTYSSINTVLQGCNMVL